MLRDSLTYSQRLRESADTQEEQETQFLETPFSFSLFAHLLALQENKITKYCEYLRKTHILSLFNKPKKTQCIPLSNNKAQLTPHSAANPFFSLAPPEQANHLPCKGD
jgi:hypothetical protein